MTKFLRFGLIILLLLFCLPLLSLAQPETSTDSGADSVQTSSYDNDFIYAWSPDKRNFALAEGHQVLLLDTSAHTVSALQLPEYPNLIRVILNLGFNPAGTKLFIISLVDEPQIDSSIMELHLLSLDGQIIDSRIIGNLAQAEWITEELINLTIYQDLSGEKWEDKCWNLRTGEITEPKKTEADN